MANGNSATLQKVLKKLEDLDIRVKKMEKERSLGVVRLSDKEMAELDKIQKEMESGREKTLKEVFG